MWRWTCPGSPLHVHSLPTSLPSLQAQYSVVNLPNLGTDKLPYAMALLNTSNRAYNFDCVISPFQQIPYRTPYVHYMLANQAYGYVVIAPTVTLQPAGFISRVWTWAAPFDWKVWIVLFGSLLVIGATMYVFEASTNDDNFGEAETTSKFKQFYHGLYFAIAGFVTKTEEFGPKTMSGRLLGNLNAFALMIAASLYIAQLAAVLSNPPTALQTISSINSFAEANVPVCVPNRTVNLDFMSTFYPQVPVQPVASVDPVYADVMQMVADGTCAGAILPDVHAQFTWGPEMDPNGTLCSLRQWGDPLNDGDYSIAWNPTLPTPLLQALDVLMMSMLEDGTYLAAAANSLFLAGSRPQCLAQAQMAAAAIAAQGAQPLMLEDLGGVFFLQVIGIGGGVVCYAVMRCSRPCRYGSPGFHFLRKKREGKGGKEGEGKEGGEEEGKPAEKENGLGNGARKESVSSAPSTLTEARGPALLAHPPSIATRPKGDPGSMNPRRCWPFGRLQLSCWGQRRIYGEAFCAMRRTAAPPPWAT